MRPFEHYLQAERLLDEADNSTNSWEIEMKIAAAGVHAQLANIVEGTAESGGGYGESGYGQ